MTDSIAAERAPDERARAERARKAVTIRIRAAISTSAAQDDARHLGTRSARADRAATSRQLANLTMPALELTPHVVSGGDEKG